MALYKMSECVFYFIDVRDATAKALYGRLFGWIVNKVNQLLAPPMASRGEDVTEIGMSSLDGRDQSRLQNSSLSCFAFLGLVLCLLRSIVKLAGALMVSRH